MSALTRHVVIEPEARWPAAVWEHDGDMPIALFMQTEDAHIFNASPLFAEALRQIADVPHDAEDHCCTSVRIARAALKDAGL